MAFLEDLGKTIGQAAQGISNAAQTIADAAQETMDQIQQQRENDSVDKCPGCGHPLDGVDVTCPMCGYELRSGERGSSISEFVRELNKLERSRNNVLDSISKSLSGKTSNPTDERIASYIRNYVVPNTKEDILEFMLLASNNIDAKTVAELEKKPGLFSISNTSRRERMDISEIILNAWLNKFEQTFQRAIISFGNDPDFQQIRFIYDSKMGEIANAKQSRRMW